VRLAPARAAEGYRMSSDAAPELAGMGRPDVVFFEVNETLFDLSGMGCVCPAVESRGPTAAVARSQLASACSLLAALLTDTARERAVAGQATSR